MFFTSNIIIGNLLQDLQKVLGEKITNKDEIIKQLTTISLRVNNN